MKNVASFVVRTFAKTEIWEQGRFPVIEIYTLAFR